MSLRQDGSPAGWARDYRCGLHSGVPRCCLRNYVRRWLPAWELFPAAMDVLAETHSFEQDAECLAAGFRPPSYVMCPDCRRAARAGERGPVGPLRRCERAAPGTRCEPVSPRLSPTRAGAMPAGEAYASERMEKMISENSSSGQRW